MKAELASRTWHRLWDKVDPKPFRRQTAGGFNVRYEPHDSASRDVMNPLVAAGAHRRVRKPLARCRRVEQAI